MQLHLDFETFSSVDIKKAGLYKYTESPDFEPLCLAWAIDDEEPKLWVCKNPIPPGLKEYLEDPGVTLCAFNAAFEHECFQQRYKEFGLTSPPALSRWNDIQALTARFAISVDLAKAAKRLGLKEKKDSRGKALIRRFCVPRKPTKKNPATRIRPQDDPAGFYDLCVYCKQDVVVEREIQNALPKPRLSAFEQKVWEHTIITNKRGLPVDSELVDSVLVVLEKWKKKGIARLKELTNEEVTTPFQVARILEFLKSQGLTINNLQAGTVTELLERTDLSPVAREILELRQKLSYSSTKKYHRLQASICKDGTVKGNVQYHGAGTGRYAGRGFQLHNLPRKKDENPEILIKAFKSRDISHPLIAENAMFLATLLVRNTLLAPPGKSFVWADYASVENRGLHWAAGDTITLEEFAQGLDQYKVFASKAWGIPLEKVTKEQRTLAKAIVLGCGYQMGAKTFQATMAAGGAYISLEQAQEYVNLYRNTYPLVKRLWHRINAAAIQCVQTGHVTQYKKVQFGYFKNNLFMKLPAGRTICYPEAEIEMVTMPWGEEKPAVVAFTEDSKTHQWVRRPIRPGRFTENLVQGLCRDILVYGMFQAEKHGYTIVGHIHDEPISLVDDSFGSPEEFASIICKKPRWAKGLPLAADAHRAKRYSKK